MPKVHRVLATARCNDECSEGCPAVLVLDNGDIAVIGKKVPSNQEIPLPDGVGVADDEHIVIVPRSVMQEAGWSEPVGATV